MRLTAEAHEDPVALSIGEPLKINVLSIEILDTSGRCQTGRGSGIEHNSRVSSVFGFMAASNTNAA